MKLYNTRSQEKETFEPREHKAVSIYICGITPYDTTHLGHAFTYVSADNLIRYLKYKKLKVRYVQNVTDIDDDILRKAKEVGEDWQQLGNRWTNHFIEDMQSLDVLPPTEYPRASQYIPEMIEMIQGLLKAGVAYEINGSVYYAVDKFPRFGNLCHLTRPQMLPIANERGNNPNDSNKKNPLDFVLWQKQAPGEPYWTSPWGRGRPGWHIECSTLAVTYLGKVVDIHGGGEDLCFPHHECEIAQVLPITEQVPFVRYWMHTAMVRDKGQKMSKSLGNLVMVRDLLKTFPAGAIRYYLASHHYRDSWSYDENDLQKAEQQHGKLKAAAAAPANGEGDQALDQAAFAAAFTNAMDDDLDTPSALKTLDSMAEAILDSSKSGRNVKDAQKLLLKYGSILGLMLEETGPEGEVIKGWRIYKK